MSYRIQRYDNRDEWLKGRQEGIGSSEVGPILGLSHFETPLKVWMRKQGLTPPQPETAAMRRGHRIEQMIATDFADATGAIIDPESVEDWHAVDTEKPWLRVSPDRLWWPAGTPFTEQVIENAYILECKSCQGNIAETDIFDVYPYWYPQVQYQMGVMGVKKCALAWVNVANPDLPFKFIYVDFDEKYYNGTIVPKLDTFWNENIIGCIQPDEVLDEDDAKLRWAKGEEGSEAVADDSLTAEVNEYANLKAQMKELESRCKDIELDVRKALQDKETLLTRDGQVLATWKTFVTAGKFDTERFKEENAELYEKYVAEKKESRRLTIKPPKPGVAKNVA